MKIKVEQNSAKKRLDIFLADYFNNKYPRSKISSLIEKKIIYVNQKPQKPSYKLKQNDIIELEIEDIENSINQNQELEPFRYKLHILYEDDDLMVINKPKNMLSHPTKYEREKTLVNALLYHTKELSDIAGSDRLGIVHRLDKNTAGLIITAKNNASHQILAQEIKEKKAKRKYLALALGEFKEKEGTIDKPLVHYIKDDVKMRVGEKGLQAVTNYKVIEQFEGAALVELELKTGRTHQIRAHLNSINHPIFGDNLYGARGYLKNEFKNIKTNEQLLQSYYLSFYHPKTNEKMEFELKYEDFSEDFIKVLNFLRSNKNEH